MTNDTNEMTYAEQHRIVSELKEYAAKMSREEQEEFTMLVKRDRDEEELDRLAKRRLLELHERYARRTGKRANPLDALFGAGGDATERC
ncbi:MAG: hypothetical protein QHI48_01025 [Bacteroidota bacterium]|nr:hypothetical protein [Bacteroidota bacterium]